MTTRTTGQDVVDALFDGWTRHDTEAIGALYAENAVVHDPAYPEPLSGRDAIKRDASDFFTAFPDLDPRVKKVFPGGDSVAMEGAASGTHNGPLALPTGVLPPTNKRIAFNIAIVMDLDAAGRIREERRYYDVAGMLTQLGIMQ